MTLPHPLSDELAGLVAHRLRVIAEPTRIKILDRLRDGERTGGELQHALGASQQNVSKHLALLHEAGIVGRRRDGHQVYYGIEDESVFAICDHVCGSIQQHARALTDLVGSAT
jgi:DNA-binding transcriptional ArsR family regulator